MKLLCHMLTIRQYCGYCDVWLHSNFEKKSIIFNVHVDIEILSVLTTKVERKLEVSDKNLV